LSQPILRRHDRSHTFPTQLSHGFDVNGILRVAVPVPLPQLFDYLAPSGVDALGIAPGTRVLVPFGRGRRVGVVVESADSSDISRERLKRVSGVLDPMPVIGSELMQTLRWTARYYQHPLGEVLETALPTHLRSARALPVEGDPGLTLVIGADVEKNGPRAGSRAAQLLAMLHRGPLTHAALDIALPEWRSAATNLRRRGLIANTVLTASKPLRANVDGPPLTNEQRVAVDAIDAHQATFQPVLLEGITGSGKTEVYLSLIERVIGRGQQTLVLVPEIGLTPQTLRRFRERLPGRIEALHSGLSDGERTRAWLAAARGDADVVIGTRSAVFTPLPRAGLILIDEEHDASYKQQEGLRYSARDLALVRGKALSVPVVLGSATPSLETLANVESNRYAHVRLSARPGAARLPKFRCVDLRGKPLQHGLAQPVIEALRACVARGEQALVFRNRRGYAPVLLCHSCGWHADCDRCDKPLTWHRGAARLRCHHCGADQAVPSQCPQCANPTLASIGLGTERLEENLEMLLPGTRIVRIDRETTRRKNALEDLFAQLPPDQAGVFVGTQMLAKGHDLPNLTLVVIVDVDAGLFSVDFRAGERLSQLVVQVAGRAGRALKPGEVLLQTHHPDDPLLHHLLRHGYDAAARELLVERREAKLPPYAHLALLRAAAKTQTAVDDFLNHAMALAATPNDVSLLGPLPAPMPRRAGLYRGQVLLNSDQRMALQAFLPEWLARIRQLRQTRNVRWSLDVDPVDLY
jgi:primosomal protein N' (replication factor Y) (superfamily II helicase)